MFAEKTQICHFRDGYEEKCECITTLTANSRKNKQLKNALEIAKLVEGHESNWQEILRNYTHQQPNSTTKKRKRPDAENTNLKAIQQQIKKLKEEEKLKQAQEKLKKLEEKQRAKEERERVKEEKGKSKEERQRMKEEKLKEEKEGKEKSKGDKKPEKSDKKKVIRHVSILKPISLIAVDRKKWMRSNLPSSHLSRRSPSPSPPLLWLQILTSKQRERENWKRSARRRNGVIGNPMMWG
jgi:hypothetical protein